MEEVRRGPRGRHLPPDGGYGSVGLRRWIVQELVTEDVLAHEAAGGRFGSSPVRRPRRDVAGLVEHVTSSVTVPEREVRAYYARNRDLYRCREARRVRHILVPDEASARELARRIASGDEDGRPGRGGVDRCRQPVEWRRPGRCPSWRAEWSAGGRDLRRRDRGRSSGRSRPSTAGTLSGSKPCGPSLVVPYRRRSPGHRGRAPRGGAHPGLRGLARGAPRGAGRHRTRIRASRPSDPRAPEPQALIGGGRR